MTLEFELSSAVGGNGTLTLAVAGTAPEAGLPVFANATPAQAAVVLAGLPACAGATGAIDPVLHTLVITLPSGCVLPALVPVSVELPSGFFAPNPPAGTSVVVSLATSTDPEPRITSAYTIGVRAVLGAVGRLVWGGSKGGEWRGVAGEGAAGQIGWVGGGGMGSEGEGVGGP